MIPTVGGILATMVLIALIEGAVPLRPRGRWGRRHVRPNLSLTFLAFATNALLDAAFVATLFGLEARHFGLLRVVPLHPLVAGVITVLMLDFSFYVAHVALHRVPPLWRYHRVHHADPAVDVTTTIRQHPGETVIRYAFLAAFAFAIGAGPGAFAVYRMWSALSGLLEHANVRVPLWLDRGLSLFTTWPYLHKIHHSRTAVQSNTNYGNICSLFDRLFSTFTPSRQGVNIAYGLDGFDDPVMQTTAGLLAIPFRDAEPGAEGPPAWRRRAGTPTATTRSGARPFACGEKNRTTSSS